MTYTPTEYHQFQDPDQGSSDYVTEVSNTIGMLDDRVPKTGSLSERPASEVQDRLFVSNESGDRSLYVDTGNGWEQVGKSEFSQDINLNGNDIQNVNDLYSAGGTFIKTDASGTDRTGLYDAANSQVILEGNEGGAVGIPNGNLTMGSGNAVVVDDPGNSASGSRVALTSPNGAPGIVIREGDGTGGTARRWDIRVNGSDLEIEDDTGAVVNQFNAGGGMILNGNLDLNNNYLADVNAVDSTRNTSAYLRTEGGGTSYWRVYDQANAQDIVRWNEGGTIDVPNGGLDVAGYSAFDDQGGIFTYSTTDPANWSPAAFTSADAEPGDGDAISASNPSGDGRISTIFFQLDTRNQETTTYRTGRFGFFRPGSGHGEFRFYSRGSGYSDGNEMMVVHPSAVKVPNSPLTIKGDTAVVSPDGEYEIQKNGIDDVGIINLKT